MLRTFYVLMAVTSIGNGLIMLFNPETWYEELIPGVQNTGPMNLHFQRDIGLAFLASGCGLTWAAFHLKQAWPMHYICSIFISGHGIFHVVEILRGSLPAEHWRYDALGVFLPSAIMLALCLPPVWRWTNPEVGPDPE